MVKSIITTVVEPGYEPTLFAYLNKDRQVLEAHQVSYENAVVAFIDSKDEDQAEEFARELRSLRMVRNVRHQYILAAAKAGFGRLPGKNEHLALIFGHLDAGAEEATLESLADQKSARDVLAITGENNVLITTAAKDLGGLWEATGGLLKNIRFLSGTETYITLHSEIQE